MSNEQIIGISQIHSINLKALKGFYPIINNIITTFGVVSVFEVNNETEEFVDIDCKGPLFLVETQTKELWFIVLNQTSLNVYKYPIHSTSKFIHQDGSLTLQSVDQPIIQFCFLDQNAEKTCQNVVEKLKTEFNFSVRANRLLQTSLTYCSFKPN